MTYCSSITIQNGESWKVSNCTTAICINGKITETPTPCPTPQQPICANGRKVVKVNEHDGCCFHYECECKLNMEPVITDYHFFSLKWNRACFVNVHTNPGCRLNKTYLIHLAIYLSTKTIQSMSIPFANKPTCLFQLIPIVFIHGSCYPAGVCSGWAGSHYITFDGKSYSFKENCSYFLVKEIITKYNLTIIVKNEDCDPSDSTFCPQALIVTYGTYTVVLTQLKTSGTAANVVSNQINCQ